MENTLRSRGKPQNYKFDRGGTPAEMGPYVGEVMNNVDSIRSGRLQVYIEQFAGTDKENQNLWRTVSYCPPFYGATPRGGTAGDGTYLQGNPQSYGMWFTPPDLGVQVLCFFVNGDPNQGYYVGCIPSPGQNHMVPAIGAIDSKVTMNDGEAKGLAGATQLPVQPAPNFQQARQQGQLFEQIFTLKNIHRGG